MAGKFDPPPSELRFRLIASLAGLALMAGGLWYRRGEDWGPAAYETILIGTVFFGGSAIWSARRLWRSRSR